MDFFLEKNIEFLDFLNDTLQVKKFRRWDELAGSITELKMKLIYRKFAKLFPRNHDYITELAALPSGFKTIHYSTLKGTTIIDEVIKFSLYSDSILVFHPIQNPAITNQQMDPGRNPKLWLPDFVNAIYFYIVLQKWVRAGIVQLIVNPFNYDDDFYNKILEQAKKRVEKAKIENYVPEVEAELAEKFATTYKDTDSVEKIKAHLISLKNPVYTESEADAFALKIKAAIPKINPIYASIPKHLITNQIMASKSGGPVESIISLADLTGGNIYTPSQWHWKTMQEIGKNEFWLKLNHVYSKVDLPFLANVDTDFALNIRQEDRLASVRAELKKLFSELNKTDIQEIDEHRVSTLYEGFKDEIRKAGKDWELIKKQSSIARQHLAISVAAIPIMVNHPLSILPIALYTGNSLISNIRDAKVKEGQFRVKNPVSVFVDVQNAKEGFFSQLKNCIF